ncbi:unnamed protein product [Linum trigynum]|uniref:Uncharacterized protein n=1 Tax=Linum trigynum TaxID=586398 RepID=A0AAV2E6S1_9ROSI
MAVSPAAEADRTWFENKNRIATDPNYGLLGIGQRREGIGRVKFLHGLCLKKDVKENRLSLCFVRKRKE